MSVPLSRQFSLGYVCAIKRFVERDAADVVVCDSACFRQRIGDGGDCQHTATRCDGASVNVDCCAGVEDVNGIVDRVEAVDRFAGDVRSRVAAAHDCHTDRGAAAMRDGVTRQRIASCRRRKNWQQIAVEQWQHRLCLRIAKIER